MMKTWNAAAFALLALSLMAILFVPGCTSNKFKPCCSKSGLFDAAGGKLANQQCFFPNGTLFGGCTTDENVSGVAFCESAIPEFCEDLTMEEDCVNTANCIWNDTFGNPANCTGGRASRVMGVCKDLIPSSCVNKKCTAMICGYSTLTPPPPPSSQDWEAGGKDFENGGEADIMPESGMVLPSVNLQKATCDFNPMTKKLFNKVAVSRGGLWVNSFRFGVGSSFGDFEAARNYFPATDRVCAANPQASIDRFTVYLNYAGSYCDATTQYYNCTGNNRFAGLMFADLDTCKLYCGNDTAPDYQCTWMDPGPEQYLCNEDSFVYPNKATCAQKCSLIDTGACANDESIYPFLNTDETDEARYRMRYVTDYMTDTSDVSSSYTIFNVAEPSGTVSTVWYNHWITPVQARDYAGTHNGWHDGPWFWHYNCSYINGWKQWDGDPSTTCYCCPDSGYPDKLGEQRTYFDNRAYGAPDFDYGYYAKNLLKQYENETDPVTGRHPYECTSSIECLSGNCDKTYYNRGMCAGLDGTSIDCWCRMYGEPGDQHLSCWRDVPNNVLYYRTGKDDDNTGLPIIKQENGYSILNPDHGEWQEYSWGWYQSTAHFWYYSNQSDYLRMFGECGITPVQRSSCIMKDKYAVSEELTGSDEYGNLYTYTEWSVEETPDLIVKSPDSSGRCDYYAETSISLGCPFSVCGVKGIHPGGTIPPAAPPQTYKEYHMDVNWCMRDDSNHCISPNWKPGEFGFLCKGTGSYTDATTYRDNGFPFVELEDLGWCAPCTYATLAVQEVNWRYAPNGLDTVLNGNPGGKGNPRQYSCYEYRADFNYVPGHYQYGGDHGAPIGTYDGQAREGGDLGSMIDYVTRTTRSTAIVRSNSNPSEYAYDYNGNVEGLVGSPGSYSFLCSDGWHGFGWWPSREIPMPSAPYLKEKLTSYLQSNVMPILDEVNAQTYSYVTVTLYPPIAVCNEFGGDGGVIHAVGDSSMLAAQTSLPPTYTYGSIHNNDFSPVLLEYMGLPDTGNSVFLVSNETAGKNAILARTEMLKEKCNTPPLVGIEIMPGETLPSLIGNLSEGGEKGKLFKFFFDESKPDFNFKNRVARGIPDAMPDKVDLLLQDWYPLCLSGNHYNGDAEMYEVDKRLEFTRALAANFSKPSLIWKFAFPENTQCNKAVFLDYLFNNTAAMVDSSIIGFIYSDWQAAKGRGLGPSSRYYVDTASYDLEFYDGDTSVNTHTFTGFLHTGLTTLSTFMRRSITDSSPVLNMTLPLDDPVSGKGDLFCALESFSKRTIGYIKLSYGQKLYAENQTCECVPCTGYDFAIGVCDTEAVQNDPNIDQLYCNDGTTCAMPSGSQEYHKYRCDSRCMNATACELCSENTGDTSFCRITPNGEETIGAAKLYSEITDDYWEFLAGLSPKEKCCLVTSPDGQNGSKYTYTMLTGSKQRAEFLQYPTRGEQNIDCGRTPDTSVLTYCNIRVPISQKEIACMRIENP